MDGAIPLSGGRGFGRVTNSAATVKQAMTITKKDQALQNSCEILHLAADADAFPLQQGKQNDHRYSGDFDALGAVECREHVAHVFADNNADGTGGAASGKPVAPSNDEARIIAQRAARKIVLSATVGDGRAEFGKLECADQRIKRANEPDGEE